MTAERNTAVSSAISELFLTFGEGHKISDQPLRKKKRTEASRGEIAEASPLHGSYEFARHFFREAKTKIFRLLNESTRCEQKCLMNQIEEEQDGESRIVNNKDRFPQENGSFSAESSAIHSILGQAVVAFAQKVPKGQLKTLLKSIRDELNNDSSIAHVCIKVNEQAGVQPGRELQVKNKRLSKTTSEDSFKHGTSGQADSFGSLPNAPPIQSSIAPSHCDQTHSCGNKGIREKVIQGDPSLHSSTAKNQAPSTSTSEVPAINLMSASEPFQCIVAKQSEKVDLTSNSLDAATVFANSLKNVGPMVSASDAFQLPSTGMQSSGMFAGSQQIHVGDAATQHSIFSAQMPNFNAATTETSAEFGSLKPTRRFDDRSGKRKRK